MTKEDSLKIQFGAKINNVAGKTIAICFAIVMLAPIIFSGLQYYFKIKHPSWIFWGALILSCSTVSVLRYPKIKPNGVDFLMTSLLLAIAMSIYINKPNDAFFVILEIFSFLVIPYLSARLLEAHELEIFFWVSGFVAFTGMLVAIGGLLGLDNSDLRSDRIKTLFAVIDTSGVVLFGGGVIPHLSLAAGWMALISIYSLTDRPANEFKLTDICMRFLFHSASILLLFLFGLRGALIAALATCMLLVAIGRSSIKQRALIMLLTVVASVYSITKLSPERASHLSAITTLNLYRAGHLSDLREDLREVKGNGIAARLLMFYKTKALLKEFPIFGVGVGRWGIVSGCSGQFGTPHNFILHATAELGLFGAFILVLLIMTASIKIFAIKRACAVTQMRISGLTVSFYCFLFIQSQFSGNYIMDFQLYGMFGAIAGIIASLGQDKLNPNFF
jgi:O-antigen ligase